MLLTLLTSILTSDSLVLRGLLILHRCFFMTVKHVVMTSVLTYNYYLYYYNHGKIIYFLSFPVSVNFQFQKDMSCCLVMTEIYPK